VDPDSSDRDPAFQVNVRSGYRSSVLIIKTGRKNTAQI
jgi:hypothetical protein